MDKPYKALTIARWFVAWAGEDQADLSNLKLQKLLYYAQGWHLARFNEPLFSDEMQAWSHGPVVPSVYRAFKSFGSNDIGLEDEFDWQDVDDETAQFLIEVWNTYGIYGAWQLRNLTNAEAPWRDNFNADERFITIPVESLRHYFKVRAGAPA